MEKCGILDALRYIEELSNSLPKEDRGPIEALYNKFNKERAELREAVVIAGAKPLSIHQTFDNLAAYQYAPPKSSTSSGTNKAPEQNDGFDDVIINDVDQLIDDTKDSKDVLRELFRLNKERALSFYDTATTFVLSGSNKSGGNFKGGTNTITLSNKNLTNETVSHELVHSLQGDMLVSRLSGESVEFVNKSIDDFLSFSVGISAADYPGLWKKLQSDGTHDLDRHVAEKVYLTAIATGDYVPKGAIPVESVFAREFTAIIGSSPEFRKAMYGVVPKSKKVPFKLLVTDILKSIKSVKALVSKILKEDPEELYTNEDYLSAVKLLDEYLSATNLGNRPARSSTKTSNSGSSTPAPFDKELDGILTDILQKQYPEIALIRTEEDIEEGENDLYQKTSLSAPIDSAPATDLGAVTKALKDLYPGITDKDVDTVVSKYGKDKVDAAVTALSNVTEDLDHATIPLEYSLVYVDLLQSTTYVNNSIKATAKSHNVDFNEAKVVLATKMAEYVLNQTIGGQKQDTSKDNDFIRKVWNNIIKVFSTLFNNKQLQKERSNRSAVILAGRLLEGISSRGLSLKKLEGTGLVDPTHDFNSQPFAAGVVEDIMRMSDNAAVFTGSEALAMQGSIYRKQGEHGTDLHDLDFTVPSSSTVDDVSNKLKKKYTAYEAYTFYVPRSIKLNDTAEMIVEKVPSLLALAPAAKALIKVLPKTKISTLVVLPKEYKIANIKRFRGDDVGRITSYDVVDSKGKVVGTYRANVEAKSNSFRTELLGETTTGVTAVFVDLIESPTKTPPAVWKSPNGVNISINNHKDVFQAKNDISSFIPRNKDIVDFNSFYNPSFSQSDTEKFQLAIGGGIKGKAVIEAKQVFINTLLQTQDTLPHEYAHHYISWFRDTEIVQVAIKKWGSEEALVQAIGEQVVEQKGLAAEWWKKFTAWLRSRLDINKANKEILKNVLTDAFLERADLTTLKSVKEDLQGYNVTGGMVTNSGQTAAINTMLEWYKDRSSGSYLLQGRGGTGKTTVINTFLKESGIRPDQVTFAAPTNQAKKVLQQANSGSIYAKNEYYTLAQILGLKPQWDFDLRENKFVIDEFSRDNNPITLGPILVVDEASMIETFSYNELQTKLQESGTRVIFMGDSAQLPPIEENSIRSLVFEENKDTTSTLTELMRQAEGSPIQAISLELADWALEVEGGLLAGKNPNTLKADMQTKVLDGDKFGKFDVDTNEGVLLTNESFSDILPSFISDYLRDPKGTKFIHFNNHTKQITKDRVRAIRQSLYGDRIKGEVFIPGEPIILNGPYQLDAETRLDNGEQFTVVSSIDTEIHIDYVVGGSTRQSVNKIPVHQIVVSDNITGKEYTINKYSGTDPKGVVDAEIASLYASRTSNNPKAGGMLKQSLGSEISYGYIINSHRSQGSSYNTVYTDLGNVLGQFGPSANTATKGMYVASSRPRKKLVIMDNRNARDNQVVNGSVLAGTEAIHESIKDIDSGEFSGIIKSIDKNCKG